MPVPAPRDPGAARDILTGWLGDPARLSGARITDLRTPGHTGYGLYEYWALGAHPSFR